MKENALSAKVNGKWVSYSTRAYIDICYNFAYGLLESGLKRGDKIVTITDNRPEWNFADHGMSMCGIVHVPVYTSLNKSEYFHVLKHSEARMVFVADKKLYKKLEPVCKEACIKDSLFVFDASDDLPVWLQIVDKGRMNRRKWSVELENIMASISEKDFASLIYTSGTTGTSKGVMLSHENLVQNFIAAAGVFSLSPEDKYLSILPLCHVGGRMGNYQSQYSGTGIYYAESMGAFAKTMKEIRADGFDAVPRVLEKVYDNIIAKGNQLTGFKHKLFFWAVKLGLKYKPFGENGWLYEKKLRIADKMIFSKWREALGGNVRIVGCGGASLQPRLERLFWAAGVKILNMYGLTETSPIITINRQVKPEVKLGTIGPVIKGIDVMIDNNGEILCRGHNVMLGYYKDDELTASVIDKEGWFHTGDIGHLVDGKFLVVTDRKKEIFKLSNGKFIAPQVIENLFRESQLIDQLMVVGEHQKFASALIVPDFDQLKKWGDKNNITFSSDDELICMPEVQRYYKNEITRLNKMFNEHEQILRFRLVKNPWTPESGELSPTLKLKRKVVSDRYGDLIDSIYG